MQPYGVGEILLAIVAALALPVGVVLTYELRGRRERRRLDGMAFAVQFEPPEGLSPTEAGVLMDGEAHPYDILATMFDLANRGYMRIRKVVSSGGAEDYELTLSRPESRAEVQLKPHEEYILSIFFGAGKQAMTGSVIGSGALDAAKSLFII